MNSEQRARELLAEELRGLGLHEDAYPVAVGAELVGVLDAALRAIARALEQREPGLCGCGKPAEYMTADGGWCCNKYSVKCRPEQPEGREAVDKDFFVVPEGLDPRTTNLVARFATALAEKLAAAERKYGYRDDWAWPSWMDECRRKLVEHVAKGDPRDVAAYCAFLWHHGEKTAMPQPTPPANAPEAWVEFALDRMFDGLLARHMTRDEAREAMLAAAQQPKVGA